MKQLESVIDVPCSFSIVQCKWAENEGRPSSGSLVQIHTHEGKTVYPFSAILYTGFSLSDMLCSLVFQEFVHT